MDQDGFNGFDDFIRSFNEYISSFNHKKDNESNESNESNEECEFGSSNANATKAQREACSDVPGGFQDFNPQILNLITVLFGNIAAQKMPFNVQNALGNWLQLFGQVIITFNAQQQYYQGGPGRIYNPIYRNAANPFCSSASDESQVNVASNKKKKSTSSNSSKESESNNEICELKQSIELLNKQIEQLQKQIDDLKEK